jgi:alpha-N-arabinofuranosidase
VESGTIALFLVNRHPSDDIVLDVDVRAVRPTAVGEQFVLRGDDVRATNSAAEPDRVRARPANTARLDGARLEIPLPAVSWTALTLACDGDGRREDTV